MGILSTAASLTVADLVDETKSHLAGDNHFELNRLSASVSSSVETFNASFNLGGITAGSRVAVDDEVMYVTSTSSPSVNILRGVDGTVAASHAASALVEVNARFPKPLIKKALRDEIRSWPKEVFDVATVEVEADNVTTQIGAQLSQAIDVDLGTDWYFGLELRHEPGNSSESTWAKVQHWDIDRDANTSDFTNGNALIVKETVPSSTLRLVYAKPFDVTTFDDSTTLLGTVGLDASMVDIPPLGAAARLLAPLEAGRADPRPRGVSQSADAVPPGHLTSAANNLRQLRNRRLAEEQTRLRAKYPVRT